MKPFSTSHSNLIMLGHPHGKIGIPTAQYTSVAVSVSEWHRVATVIKTPLVANGIHNKEQLL